MNTENMSLFLEKNGNSITKPLAMGYAYKYKPTDRHAYVMTNRINEEDINKLPMVISPSLIQKEIDKLFEIRSHYLDGVFYSSAIFSQSNNKTRIDFRNYDKSNPNRFVPYKLPNTLEEKLKKIMNEVNLNSGSFDIICTLTGEYILLEVNPIGQYLQVSNPCNYLIEKYIAKYLMSCRKVN